jgi:SNF2 family DNA or RNA helicase
VDESAESLVPAVDYWNEVDSGKHNSDLDLLGLADLVATYFVAGNKIHLSLKAITEAGDFLLPKDFDSRADNFVSGKYWIPLRKEHSDALLVFQRIAASDFLVANARLFFESLKAFTRCNIPVTVPDEISQALEVTASEDCQLAGKPFEYQRIGISWLSQFFDSSLGTILADEMGLGKTYQSLGLIDHVLRTTDLPILIVCPSTLILNWRNEFQKFLPTAEPYLHWGADRVPRVQRKLSERVVITTYGILNNDIANLRQIRWGLVVCDEAQKLKNRKTRSWQSVHELESSAKTLVTGTPFENHLSDIWSLVELVNPGLLGDAKEFDKAVQSGETDARYVSNVISPLIMRRLVRDVDDQLPECVESEEVFQVSPSLAIEYDARLQLGNAKSPRESFLQLSGALLRLCAGVNLGYSGSTLASNPKAERLLEISDELFEVGQDKVIVFVHWREPLSALIALLAGRYGQERVGQLHGDIPNQLRQGIVDEFNAKPGFAVLVCNPKVAGVGLNITGANHVIHFSREWNPMLERQATARAWRKGQKKTVFVHKFVYSNTIEQVVVGRMKAKEDLSDLVLSQALMSEEAALQARARLISPLRQLTDQP